MRRIILYCILLFVASSKAQTDSSYIQKFPNDLVVKPYIDYKVNHFNLEENPTGAFAKYRTPQVPRIGIGASYKWASFLMSITPLYKENQEAKGSNSQMDIQWNLYLKAINTDLRYQKYSGYYLRNSKSLKSWDMNEKGYYKRPDLNVESIGVNLRYKFNWKKFSAKAAFSQTERQLKSAGTAMIGVRWNYLGVQADSAIVPSIIQPSFQDFDQNQLRIYDQGIGLGYSYSFVKKNWFLNVTAMPFALYQIIHLENTSIDKSETLQSLQFIFQCRGAIGYNSVSDYCGITFVSDQMRSRWKNSTDISYNFANVKLFYARRIGLKKKKKD